MDPCAYVHAGGPTKILDIVTNERLVTDWLDWRGDITRPLTRLAWLLESAGTKTPLTIVHDGFSRTADMSDYRLAGCGSSSS